ncbi:hypothetical protein [Anoxybacillus ayderensis]|uniref:hypothetical protein n=1 Tax=Anoxybacillus ayderensis TaxID=265546 RepID=UPI000A27121E|nr:hypothetical protein [Anoxybacillus ayderensis]OSX53222.1 hypothetical protein B7H16_12745 [Anoxybacillus ayderensis]
MINPKQLIAKCKFQEKKYRKNTAKLKQYLYGNWSSEHEENIERFVPTMYVIAKNNLRGLHEQFQTKLIEMEHSAFQHLTNLVGDEKFNNETVLAFITQQIIPYYIGRFNIMFSRELSFLPLLLRLKVYLMMYEAETNLEVKWHIRDRIMVTVAKLGECEIAELLALLNWFEQLYKKDINANYEFITNITFIHQARETRKTILKERGYKADHPLDEVSNSLSLLLDLNKIHDKKMALLIFELLTIYYPFLKNNELCHIIPNFIKTEDHNLLGKLGKEINKIPINYSNYFVNHKNEAHLLPDELSKWLNTHREEQLKLYIQKQNSKSVE